MERNGEWLTLKKLGTDLKSCDFCGIGSRSISGLVWTSSLDQSFGRKDRVLLETVLRCIPLCFTIEGASFSTIASESPRELSVCHCRLKPILERSRVPFGAALRH